MTLILSGPFGRDQNGPPRDRRASPARDWIR